MKRPYTVIGHLGCMLLGALYADWYEEDQCYVDPFASRTCARGTNGCVSRHTDEQK